MRSKSSVISEPLDVPEDWNATELGSICEQRREIVQPTQDGTTRYVGLEHIDPGSALLKRYGSDADVRSSKSRFYAGDVLYGKLRPYLDKVVLAEWDGICSTDILVFRVIEQCSTPEFLAHRLHSTDFLAHAINTTSGVNHPRTSWGDIKSFKLALPPLPEQRAIAHVLSKIQAAAETQAKIAERARELKRALMAKLFTEGLRGESLRETEIGTMPEGWEIVKLGVIATIGNGSTPKRTEEKYWTGGNTPWLTSGKVHDGTIFHADEFVTEAARRECHLPIIPKGSIVVAITGQGKTLGNSAMLAIDACINQHLAYLTISNKGVHAEFVLTFLRSRYDYFQSIGHAGGSTKGALTCGFLKNFEIPLPPLEEQREIAHILQTVDAKIEAAERKRAGLDELFHAMLGQLMTGRVRTTALIESLFNKAVPKITLDTEVGTLLGLA